jgi:acetoin utilization deacetylase AcuC-like enzyme
MPNVGLVYDQVYLKHDTGAHPENGRRLTTIMEHLNETHTREKLINMKPFPATERELMLVHSNSHILHIKQEAEGGGGYLDADTVVSFGSFEAALYAVGGAIKATEAVMTGEVESAFALVRPPGHHATRDETMGFCLFNNIAIAAKYAFNKYPIKRIAIIDFDVHHGNGTQAAFEANPDVLYVSTHEAPLYPGSGSVSETGTGEAKGTKVNIPLPAGCGNAEYERAYREIVVPVVTRFKPELIMVSAGYDAHFADDLAMMRLTISGYSIIVKFIKELADSLCKGRIVLCLEGGYNLNALAASVKATFDVLLGNSEIQDTPGKPDERLTPPDITPVLEQVKKIHKLN